MITPTIEPLMLQIRSVSDEDRVGRYTWISSIARLMMPETVTVRRALRNAASGPDLSPVDEVEEPEGNKTHDVDQDIPGVGEIGVRIFPGGNQEGLAHNLVGLRNQERIT